MENTICLFERNYVIVIKTFQVTTPFVYIPTDSVPGSRNTSQKNLS